MRPQVGLLVRVRASRTQSPALSPVLLPNSARRAADAANLMRSYALFCCIRVRPAVLPLIRRMFFYACSEDRHSFPPGLLYEARYSSVGTFHKHSFISSHSTLGEVRRWKCCYYTGEEQGHRAAVNSVCERWMCNWKGIEKHPWRTLRCTAPCLRRQLFALCIQRKQPPVARVHP